MLTIGQQVEQQNYLGSSSMFVHCDKPAQSNDVTISKSDLVDDKIMSVVISELSKVLKADQIDLDREELKQRGKPWNSYHKISSFPNVIILPESTEDVSAVVKICSKYKVPIIPFGGGTSLEGQTLTPKGGVSLDFAHMKNILELNEQDLDVRVQAGLGYVELNEQLKSKHLWFPLDPASVSSVVHDKRRIK